MHQDLYIGLLGLCGAFVNAATRLSAAIFADQDPTTRQIARAWSQFGVSVFFGPIAAVVFTPVIVGMAPKAFPPAVAVAVGLSANALWPLFVEGLVPAFKKKLGGWMVELGTAIGRSDEEKQ